MQSAKLVGLRHIWPLNHNFEIDGEFMQNGTETKYCSLEKIARDAFDEWHLVVKTNGEVQLNGQKLRIGTANQIATNDVITIHNSTFMFVGDHRAQRFMTRTENIKCTICMELFIKAMTIPCGHSFCHYCITRWRTDNPSCPICRQKISRPYAALNLDAMVRQQIEVATSSAQERHYRLFLQREDEYERQLREPGIIVISSDED